MAKRIDRGVGNVNDFPDDVLCYIISFLPTKDAIRTSILSTRWRYLFTLLSNLDLQVNGGNPEELKRFLNYVDGLMFHLNMPSVLRFRLRCGRSSPGRRKRCCVSVDRVSDWICALIRHKIQELDIMIDSGAYNNCSFLPPILFSCESLVALKLNFHYLINNMQTIFDRICLPNLKIIHFQRIRFQNDSFVEKLFSSCPVLEDLVLNGCTFVGSSVRFSVSNSNLKTLTLKNIRSAGSTCVLINAPSLVVLNYYNSKIDSLEFVDVKSLSEALITSSIHIPFNFFIARPDALSWMQNIKALRIGFFFVKVFQCSKVPSSLFEKMTYLKIWFQELHLDHTGFDPIALEYFLARCVVLKTLVFEESGIFDLRRTNKRYSLQESQLTSLLRHLKTIKIRLLDIGHIIVLKNVIKFFLKNAKVLEVLKINSKQGCSEERSKITRRIMNYPRASKKCSIVFFDTSKRN